MVMEEKKGSKYGYERKKGPKYGYGNNVGSYGKLFPVTFFETPISFRNQL